jgi:diketogulonate reductase-like aldo/keto reductase
MLGYAELMQEGFYGALPDRAKAILKRLQSNGKHLAIPESGSPAHVKENAVALALTLTPQELQTLDAAHPRR